MFSLICFTYQIFTCLDDNSHTILCNVGISLFFILLLPICFRRTFSNQILQVIRDEGAFSTMHTFLVYLQMAPMEQQPATASLLLQLDLLVCVVSLKINHNN